MRIEDQLRHAKRVIADQAIQMAALSEALDATSEELAAAKQALATDISSALGQNITVDGTIARAVE